MKLGGQPCYFAVPVAVLVAAAAVAVFAVVAVFVAEQTQANAVVAALAAVAGRLVASFEGWACRYSLGFRSAQKAGSPWASR